jgi:hypothetical protein
MLALDRHLPCELTYTLSVVKLPTIQQFDDNFQRLRFCACFRDPALV